jgi:hypothetical protein
LSIHNPQFQFNFQNFVNQASIATSLSAPVPGTNGTSTQASIDYDVSVAAMTLHNRNQAMAVWRHGPLEAKLSFSGRRFSRARLTGADRPSWSAWRWWATRPGTASGVCAGGAALGTKQSQIPAEYFTKHPLIWIAVINRDPN